jgi:hypothetical protein
MGEASVFGFEIFAPAVRKATHSKTWLDHSILTGVGVRCRSAGKVKMENPVDINLNLGIGTARSRMDTR